MRERDSVYLCVCIKREREREMCVNNDGIKNM